MNNIARIKAISFDADGTLWDFQKVMRHSLFHALKELSKLDPDAANKLDVEKMIEIRNKVANELKETAANLEAIRLEAFRRTLENSGRSENALAFHLNQVYLKHRFEDITLFDDVLPTLKALRAKYTLGILSNGNSYPERCGLQGFFHFVIFSQDYGIEKPDPTLFKIAIEKAGCSKQQLLHVGDSLQEDVVGAINAGVKCIWLNRQRVENTLDLKVEYEISSLSELLEILLN